MIRKRIRLVVVVLSVALLVLLIEVVAADDSGYLSRLTVTSYAERDGNWPASGLEGTVIAFENDPESWRQGKLPARGEIWLYDTATVSSDLTRSAWQPPELLYTPPLSASSPVTVYVHLPAILRGRPPQYAWSGEVVNRYPNCALTMLRGYTLDRNGGVAGDVTLHVWADGWEGSWLTSSWMANGWNWALVLNPGPMAGTWYECVVPEDRSHVCISNVVTAVTSNDCVGGFQVVETVFQQN